MDFSGESCGRMCLFVGRTVLATINTKKTSNQFKKKTSLPVGLNLLELFSFCGFSSSANPCVVLVFSSVTWQ